MHSIVNQPSLRVIGDEGKSLTSKIFPISSLSHGSGTDKQLRQIACSSLTRITYATTYIIDVR